MSDNNQILKRWSITEEQLTTIVDNNPSFRGMMLGYIAELKFHEMYLNDTRITKVTKDDDHDREKKGDRRITYNGKEFIIEVKSLQTKTVQKKGDEWVGQAQVDGSDSRDITLNNGETIKTTLYKRGEFDILAVNCFAFNNEWCFVFAKNEDLPCSNYKKYSEEQKSQLIASMVPVSLPAKSPFKKDLFSLLDELCKKKVSRYRRICRSFWIRRPSHSAFRCSLGRRVKSRFTRFSISPQH